MEHRRNEHVRDLFARALERPADERATFLARECASDPGLRAEVEGLLAALDGAGREGFLDERTGNDGEQPGDVIGRYKLLQRIGEGGFGSVYMAEQREPVKRKVALKVIKLGMDTKQVIARFEAERQALALMDHPNIAKVFDAGATDAGRPYFVMELVRGVPITEYCDKEGLSTAERLALFVSVCHAVQHAHHKGIIHRDIKPNNVLVTLHDGVPVTKIIDFGIAKATHGELTDKTLFTEYRQFIGTPQYMSPEQAEMSGLDIDSRSDIYSLGVLLYELLTGTTPLTTETLRNAALAEIQRMIREDEAQKPSTRVSSLAAGETDAGCGRRIDLHALRRQLRGDVDWIVMKALEKDRVRRYESPAAMARDLERHLQHEPVEAGPPSRFYRLRKFARRNRMAVSTGVAVVLSLLGGFTAATVGWVVARRQASNTSALAGFYERMFTSLVPYSPGASPERPKAGPVGFTELTVADLLRRSEAAIEPTFGTRPELEASVRRTFGWTFAGLGMSEDAWRELHATLELQREVLGPEHLETLRTACLLAFTAYLEGRPVESVSIGRDLLDAYRRRLGPDSVEALESERSLASMLRICGDLEDAEALLRDLDERARRVLGDDAYVTLWGRQVQGALALGRGRFDLAQATLGEVAAKARCNYPETPLAAVAMFRRASALRELGLAEEATEVLAAAREETLRRFGDRHPFLLHLDGLVAVQMLEEGDVEGAEAKLREVETRELERLGPDHFMTAITRGHLVRVLLREDRPEEAEQLARELVEAEPALRGTRGMHWLCDRFLLARAELANGRTVEAAELIDSLLTDARELLPGGFAELPEIRATRGRCLFALGRIDEAERSLLRAYDGLRELRGATHRKTRACARTLVELYESEHAAEQAEAWRERT